MNNGYLCACLIKWDKEIALDPFVSFSSPERCIERANILNEAFQSNEEFPAGDGHLQELNRTIRLRLGIAGICAVKAEPVIITQIVEKS